MSMEKKMQEIAENFLMDREEVEAAIDFVMEVLDAHILHTEKYEPYATVSIRRMKESYRDVEDLKDFL